MQIRYFFFSKIMALLFCTLNPALTVNADAQYQTVGRSMSSLEGFTGPASKFNLSFQAFLDRGQTWQHLGNNGDEEPSGNSTRIQQKQNDKPLSITKIDKENAQDLKCMALNIYFEARGESDLGKRAVAHVVINRLEHRKFPDTVCAVVQQGGEKRKHRCQFSWWCDGRSDVPGNNIAWEKSLQIAREVLSGDSNDPTGGALWYHADYVSPYWRTAFQQGPQIGQHIFYLASR